MSWYDYILFLFGISWAMVGMYRWYAIDKGIIDTPNDRSSHSVPTARGGGIVFSFATAMLLGALYYYKLLTVTQAIYFVPAFLISILGYIDDRRGLSSSLRFVVHFLCAGAFLLLIKEGGTLLQEWINLPLPINFFLLTFMIVWTINLFNFMDGTDGIATLEAIFCLTVGGYILYQAKAYELATFAWGIVAILSGFLTWNWPVAKLFMGDSGSGFLGMLIVTFALLSYKLFQIPILIWVILLSMFWFDATVTLIRRMLAKEKWYAPHRKHAYQRIVQSGWTHQQLLFATIPINIVLSGLALWAYRTPELIYVALGFAVILLTCVYILVEIAKPMYRTWHTDRSQVET
ncbi:MAG: glycosyltransferase family 4 protein [Candidatus Berkiella sp.]